MKDRHVGNARLGAFGVESSERGGPRRDGGLVGGRTVETGGWWTRRPPRVAPVGGQRSPAFEDGAAGPDQAGDSRDALSQGGRAVHPPRESQVRQRNEPLIGPTLLVALVVDQPAGILRNHS